MRNHYTSMSALFGCISGIIGPPTASTQSPAIPMTPYRKRTNTDTLHSLSYISKEASIDTTYIWQDSECYICLEEFDSTRPRIIPFECMHELCIDCFEEYSRRAAIPNNLRCGMCKKQLHRDAITNTYLETRTLSPTESIHVFTRGEYSTQPIPILRRDILQYMIVFGSYPPKKITNVSIASTKRSSFIVRRADEDVLPDYRPRSITI